MSPLKKKFSFDLLSKALLFCTLIIILATVTDYGITWDETMQHNYGRDVVNYYLSGRRDLGFQEFRDLYLYGGLFDSLAYALSQLTQRLSILGLYETRHLLNALIGFLGLFGVYQLGRLLYGARGGFLSLLVMILMPVYYGHLFANPKDIPFATFFVWSIYAILRYLRSQSRVGFGDTILVGLMIGLTLGIRVGGLLLFSFFVSGMLMSVFLDQRSLSALQKLALVLKHAQNLVIMLTISYSLMVVFWPWAQEGLLKGDAVARVWQAFAQVRHFGAQGIALVAGQHLDITHLPWWYLPIWFLVSTPLLWLSFLPLGIVHLIRPTRSSQKNSYATLAVILGYLVVPAAYAIYSRSVLYNAQRHFLFIFPVLALLSAGGIELAIRLSRGSWRILLLALSFFAVFNILISEARLHPYQTLYFNEIAGGLSGAFGRFELDYWGSSYKEGSLWLEEHYQKFGQDQKNGVFVCGDSSSATYYFRQLRLELEAPDYIICPQESIRADHFLSEPNNWLKIGAVKRLGVPINIVYSRIDIADHE